LLIGGGVALYFLTRKKTEPVQGIGAIRKSDYTEALRYFSTINRKDEFERQIQDKFWKKIDKLGDLGYDINILKNAKRRKDKRGYDPDKEIILLNKSKKIEEDIYKLYLDLKNYREG
jgi:hypothetical protein